MPSTFPSVATNLYRSEDGSLHPSVERLVIETRHNTDRYALPPEVGLITRVRLYAAEMRPFEFLECESTKAFTRVFPNGKRPSTAQEARELLRAVHSKRGKSLWIRLENMLYLYPYPVNSGEVLVVSYERAKE